MDMISSKQAYLIRDLEQEIGTTTPYTHCLMSLSKRRASMVIDALFIVKDGKADNFYEAQKRVEKDWTDELQPILQSKLNWGLYWWGFATPVCLFIGFAIAMGIWGNGN